MTAPQDDDRERGLPADATQVVPPGRPSPGPPPGGFGAPPPPQYGQQMYPPQQPGSYGRSPQPWGPPPPGAQRGGRPHGSSGVSTGTLNAAMWITLGCAALGVLGSVVAGVLFVGAGAPGIGVVILVGGLLYCAGFGFAAWRAGQGQNWGRIVLTVLLAIQLVGSLADLSAGSLVGIGLAGGLLALWWTPSTTLAMQAKARNRLAVGH